MILSRVNDYLRQHKRASLADMANGLDAAPEALRAMLTLLERKGRVRRLPAPSSCGRCCCQCDPSRVELYEWAGEECRGAINGVTGSFVESMVEAEIDAKPRALLVIGIHREELAFGEAVTAGLDRCRIEVLAIPEGLSGRRPRPDQRFQYDTLHRALYLQLLPHVVGHHDLLIDLHTGLDRWGPRADLICAEAAKLAGLLEKSPRWPPSAVHARAVRFVRLGRNGDPGEAGVYVAETVIPEKIWRNARFLYVGVEIFLPEPGPGTPEQQAFARELVSALSGIV